jgi:hypothetical protein
MSADELRQTFPRRSGQAIVHRSWTVDLDTAGALIRWGKSGAARLRQEVAEMAEHFPRWLLTVSAGRDRVLCPHCSGLLVFDNGLRCAQCERPVRSTAVPRGASLAWFGLMPPVGIDGLTRLKKGLVAKPPALHVVGDRADIGHYLLVPLVALYPTEFPAAPPRVAYLPGLFQVPGMPEEQCSHTYHMFSGGFMCLFAPGEWRATMTCRELLQQRAYAHVIKLLSYANGRRQAFAIVS